MTAKAALSEIKQDLEAFVGKRIRLRANKGRKNVLERNGILEGTYPHIFVVKLEEKKSESRRVSFSYSDILTKTVRLTVCSEED